MVYDKFTEGVVWVQYREKIAFCNMIKVVIQITRGQKWRQTDRHRERNGVGGRERVGRRASNVVSSVFNRLFGL